METKEKEIKWEIIRARCGPKSIKKQLQALTISNHHLTIWQSQNLKTLFDLKKCQRHLHIQYRYLNKLHRVIVSIRNNKLVHDLHLPPGANNKQIIIEMEDYYIINCPWCLGSVQIIKNQLNCCIFRHGTYKHNGEPMNPHASQQECEDLIQKKEIYGCGKPYRFDGQTIQICDYI